MPYTCLPDHVPTNDRKRQIQFILYRDWQHSVKYVMETVMYLMLKNIYIDKTPSTFSIFWVGGVGSVGVAAVR